MNGKTVCKQADGRECVHQFENRSWGCGQLLSDFLCLPDDFRVGMKVLCKHSLTEKMLTSSSSTYSLKPFVGWLWRNYKRFVRWLQSSYKISISANGDTEASSCAYFLMQLIVYADKHRNVMRIAMACFVMLCILLLHFFVLLGIVALFAMIGYVLLVCMSEQLKEYFLITVMCHKSNSRINCEDCNHALATSDSEKAQVIYSLLQGKYHQGNIDGLAEKDKKDIDDIINSLQVTKPNYSIRVVSALLKRNQEETYYLYNTKHIHNYG